MPENRINKKHGRGPRLTAQDWIKHAFKSLSAKGPSAVKIEALARSIGATKGSFYWHFANADALRDAMLNHWQERSLDAVVQEVNELPMQPPNAGLVMLIDIIANYPLHEYGGIGSEPALRDWARFDPVVAERLQAVDNARLAFLEKHFSYGANIKEDGAHEAAELFYAAYLGLLHMKQTPEQMRKPLLTLVELLFQHNNAISENN
ncbi:TetR/AcrR family transcriptional regulator [Polycladidibacter stylochi]|uniref:TetR/AcrR family transcriptional regulator n=1 Tax=Polycladidibacter stylochi TaxID=1807766 RepID=UPI000836BD83|nr:TetR/AcrR family transcriptional regulator [Pseudovibrio stylochi]